MTQRHLILASLAAACLAATPVAAQVNGQDHGQTAPDAQTFPPLVENDNVRPDDLYEAAYLQQRQGPTILDLLEGPVSSELPAAAPAPMRAEPLSARQQRLEKSLTAVQRTDYALPKRMQSAVDWQAAAQTKQQFSSAGRAGSTRMKALYRQETKVPVLMPERLAARTVLITDEDFYHGVMPGNGYQLSYHGTRLVSDAGERASGATALSIYQIEDGMAASFSLFGASYSVLLACDAPKTDPRCRSEAFMRGRLADLTVYLYDQQGGN